MTCATSRKRTLAPFTDFTTRLRNSSSECRLVVEVRVTWIIWPLVVPTAEM
jgi:hypothetical protein